MILSLLRRLFKPKSSTSDRLISSNFSMSVNPTVKVATEGLITITLDVETTLTSGALIYLIKNLEEGPNKTVKVVDVLNCLLTLGNEDLRISSIEGLQRALKAQERIFNNDRR